MTDGAPYLGHARLSLTFLLSLTLHAAVLLGIEFTWQATRARQLPPAMEVTLAEQPQATPPREFDFLAQANQNGGGKAMRKPEPEQQHYRPPVPPPRAPIKPSPEQTPPANPQATEPQHVPTPRADYHPTPHPDMEEILAATQRVASSKEFLGVADNASSRYPSEQRIDAQTHSSAAAEYLRQWVAKVERIGNLNYPREARERDLSGRLVLEVTLHPDGSVYSIHVLTPSPFSVLNQAAIRIVKLAAPYARVPEAVLQGHDLLVITRSWEFDDTSHFSPH
ncbi:MAG TPA: energy transducer TonB [Nitrococcus sp.]|nr:energy transducer TonB [Nitrococcus sp.]